MKILFLVPYPLGEAPSQRFRFEQYFKILSGKSISFTVHSFLDSQNWQTVYSTGNGMKKAMILISGFAKRFWMLTKLSNYDFIFIHREAAPVGPPVIEWIITHVFKKQIIYDFDDAIWATDKVKEGKIEKIIRWRNKVKKICGWAYKVSCGNNYLCDYARQFNSNVVLNPTTIDTKSLHNPVLYEYKKDKIDRIIIGWTGSQSTLKYLESIVPTIQSLEKKYSEIQFLVIANKKPKLDIKSLVFVPWNIASEIPDLLQIDIGIMPLPDDEWSRGKCGFKALQYLALEIPAIISPVGVNSTIVTQDINGYFSSTADEWYNKIELLIKDKTLRTQLGKMGRQAVEQHYSVSSNTANFLALFD